MSEVVYPCPEKTWESLEGESSESRFCDLCLKKVYAKQLGKKVYCGVDSSNSMSYHTFLVRFAMILFFAFGTSLFSNVNAQVNDSNNLSDSVIVQNQSLGEIKGLIVNKDTQEPLVFAMIILWQGDKQIAACQSDFDGNYKLKVEPGLYQIETKYLGFETPKKKEVMVSADRISIVNHALTEENYPIVGLIFEEPMKLNDHRSSTFKRDDVQRHPNK